MKFPNTVTYRNQEGKIYRSQISGKRLGWGALALAIVVAILFGLAHGKGSLARQAERQALRVLTPAQVKTNGYTSSASCRACHPSQYESCTKAITAR